jgi:hypothetical protein
MTKHGLSRGQRRYYALACARKGVRLPTKAECEDYKAFRKSIDYWSKGDEQPLREVKALCR